MSLADDAKLLLIPTGYGTSNVYSVFPTDGDGDFTYTRSGDASRVNPGGLIETVGTNIPRIDHFGGGCPTLLLEPQRTNVVQRSEQFENSYWSKQGGSSVTSNTNLAPNGTLTADTLSGATGTSVSGSVLRRNVSISGNSTLSIYVKSLGSTNFTIYIRNGSNGQVFSQSITPNSDWQRVTLTTNPANGQVFFGNTNGDVAIWGAMLELGSYETSYIKTETSTVTRQKDQCINAGDANLFDITEGTFFVDVTPFIPISNNKISLSDESANNRIEFQFRSDANGVDFLCAGQGNGLQVNRNESITYNSRNKLLVTFDDSSFKIYVNGVLEFTDTSFTKPINLDNLKYSAFNSILNFEGKVYDTRVYDRVLTQTEAETLTTL